MTLDEARALDATDPLAAVRARFHLPPGVIYLDGNSLGPLPVTVPPALADLTDRQWGDRLIRSWNEGWLEAPLRIGDRVAPLIGARGGEVVVGDSTSANLYKLIVAALRHDPARTEVVSELGNFATDLYMAEGAVAAVPGSRLRAVPRAEVAAALGERTALLLLTHVHYKTAERFDMAAMTAAAHRAGALTLWDLSHSTGAVPVDLAAASADLAVGCTYKYLNGGPGSPAFLYVAERWQAALANPLSGWKGHATPFAFDDRYAPAAGIRRWLTGTAPIIGMSVLEAALDAWEGVDHDQVWRKSARLFDILDEAGTAAGLENVTPRDPAARGSHVSFRHPDAYQIVQAMIARGVIGDFRDPDIARFGLTPLYLGHEDVWRAGQILREVIDTQAWRDPRYAERLAVT